jgi:hypothetical protein
LSNAALGKASVTVPLTVMETFFYECPRNSTRQRHFADPFVADFSISSTTLAKAYTDCKKALSSVCGTSQTRRVLYVHASYFPSAQLKMKELGRTQHGGGQQREKRLIDYLTFYA